jgi:hypothetical protein
MVKTISFIVITWLVTASCSTPAKTSREKKDTAKDLNLDFSGDHNNKIVFLTFNVHLEDSLKDLYTFSLKNSVVKDGILKDRHIVEDVVIESNYLYIGFTKDKQPGKRLIKVRDPLSSEFEYATGENKTLIKKIIRKREGVLTIRLQLDPLNNDLFIYKPIPYPGRTLKEIYHARL